MAKIIIGLLLVSISVTHVFANDFYKRAKELVSKMTLEEKILQLGSDNPPAIPRLGVKAWDWSNEALHGVRTTEPTTQFPQAIALAATWDTSLVRTIGDAVSTEARILYNLGRIHLSFWSPNINIFRDPRWGRGQETYGEDPFLTSRMAVSYVKGLQGDDSVYLKVISTPKHYAVHSGPEFNRLSFSSYANKKDLFETYLPAFKAAIQEGKARAIMSSYNAFDQTPVTGSYYFLTEILRNKFKFGGYVTSDCYAIGAIRWGHKFTKNDLSTVALALNSGCDLDCGTYYPTYMKGAIDNKLTRVERIDTALTRLFTARFLLGEFDEPSKVKYNFIPDSLLNSHQYLELARESARRSIVLLKNENQLLPLSKSISSILIVGPTANEEDSFLGNYCGIAKYIVYTKEGLINKLGSNTKIDYIKGCEIPGYILENISSKYIYQTDNSPGIKVEYFDNKNFSGNPSITRIENEINNDWGINPPLPNMPADNFSIRYTGNIKVDYSGEYVIEAEADDRLRIMINDSLVLNLWDYYNPYPRGIRYKFNKDKVYKIVIDYYDSNYGAKCIVRIGNAYSTGNKFLEELPEIAKNYDAVLFVGGLTKNWESEETKVDVPGFFGGDRTSLDLPERQTDIIKALKRSGKPVITAFTSGSALSINWVKDSIPAIIQLWYPGEQGGNALADILFGDFNPSAKLPFTMYKSVDDLPDFKDYNMKNRTYRFSKSEPLYPFGYGLSYSKFTYSNCIIDKDTASECSDSLITIKFNIKNESNFDGYDIPQVYVSNPNSDNEVAISELKGFKKIFVPAHSSVSDSIVINVKSFVQYDSLHDDYFIEENDYDIRLSKSSKDLIYSKFVHVKPCIDSIKENLNENISIFPNPANSIVFIKANEVGSDFKSIKLIDVTGKEYNNIDIIIESELSAHLITNNLSIGVYFIELNYKDSKIIKKFTIQR